jgi:acetolactate synthase-1/2/3 large subunit
VTKPQDIDDVIMRMIETPGPVIVDCVVDPAENCFPMIPSGKAHNEMLLGPDQEREEVSEEGKILV